MEQGSALPVRFDPEQFDSLLVSRPKGAKYEITYQLTEGGGWHHLCANESGPVFELGDSEAFFPVVGECTGLPPGPSSSAPETTSALVPPTRRRTPSVDDPNGRGAEAEFSAGEIIAIVVVGLAAIVGAIAIAVVFSRKTTEKKMLTEDALYQPYAEQEDLIQTLQ
jgi:hypothetical protein